MGWVRKGLLNLVSIRGEIELQIRPFKTEKEKECNVIIYIMEKYWIHYTTLEKYRFQNEWKNNKYFEVRGNFLSMNHSSNGKIQSLNWYLYIIIKGSTYQKSGILLHNLWENTASRGFLYLVFLIWFSLFGMFFFLNPYWKSQIQQFMNTQNLNWKNNLGFQKHTGISRKMNDSRLIIKWNKTRVEKNRNS